jgi:hypothetical protein
LRFGRRFYGYLGGREEIVEVKGEELGFARGGGVLFYVGDGTWLGWRTWLVGLEGWRGGRDFPHFLAHKGGVALSSFAGLGALWAFWFARMNAKVEVL